MLFGVSRGIALITLNQPEQKNSLGPSIINGLCDSLKDAFQRDDVRVVVLTNAGNTFCAGANLKGGAGEQPARYSLVDIFQMIREGPKPVVGRINGHCMGGGVGLAAACDISVVTSQARLGFTEVRIGVAPAVISVVCLPKLRRGDALRLMLGGEQFTAAHAVEVGLLSLLAEPANIDAKVQEVVSQLVRGGPAGLKLTKELINRVPDMSVKEAFAWTGEISPKMFTSPEGLQGIKSFRSRTDPPWVPAKL